VIYSVNTCWQLGAILQMAFVAVAVPDYRYSMSATV